MRTGPHAPYVVTRDLTPQECFWLFETIPKGTTVYRFHGPTYGATSGFVATFSSEGAGPFMDLPHDAVALVDDQEIPKPLQKVWVATSLIMDSDSLYLAETEERLLDAVRSGIDQVDYQAFVAALPETDRVDYDDPDPVKVIACWAGGKGEVAENGSYTIGDDWFVHQVEVLR